MTPDQMLTVINGWTVVGSIPTSFYCTGTELANCVDRVEFNTLTDAQQKNLLALFCVPGPLLVGSANVSHLAAGLMVTYFTNFNGPTMVNLTALAKATVQPWWQYAGYPTIISGQDLVNAGLV
jgi:hypothetical protein